MKIVSKRSDLLNSVNIVLRAVSSKTTLPILECMVIDISDGQIKLISNDMELAIETIVKGDIIDNQGNKMIAVSAKVFSEIIRKLSDNDITVQTDENYMVTIICEKAKFTIAGKPADEFPTIPRIEKQQPIVLSQFTLKEIIRQTVFSISDNES